MNAKIKPLRLVLAALLLFLSAQITMAQEEFYVKSLSADTRDLTARKSPRQDLNGRPCALLKVMAMDDIVSCGGVNIGDISTEGLVKLVYVPVVARSVKLNFKYHYPIEIVFADYGIARLEGQVVYNLMLTAQKSGSVVQDAGHTNVVGNQAATPAATQQASSVNMQQVQAGNVASNGLSLDGITNPILANLVRNMVRVDGGTFRMGATSEQGSDAQDDEKPVHQVTLSGYYIGKYEVTQEEWQAVMGSNPSYHKGSGKLPVEDVSWDECQEFIRRLNSLTGKTFRLPTEAEWEYAARGGNKSRGYKYAGGNNIGSVAWHDGNSGEKTHEVGGKQPNEIGMYDMSGNVFEWCSDWYSSYSSSSQENPMGASSGSFRVYRGSSMLSNAVYDHVARRFNCSPSLGVYNLGLRLAL